MELKAVVRYEGALAYYSLSPESGGIYQARLIRYEGETERLPPRQIVMVRGIRRWAGSSDRQDLLNELGQVIDERSRDPNASSPESKR